MLRSWLGKRGASPIPAPISIEPTNEFDGDDGPWSSFPIQIGTPPQVVRLLISTASSQTWVVSPLGCNQSDPPNCSTSRGGVFESTSSRTWQQDNVTANGIVPLLLEANLNYTGNNINGAYGYDTVTLGGGSGGPTLDQQIVASIATPEYSSLGLFGLNPSSSSLTNSSVPRPSFVSNLNDSGMIPSLTWGYTAGNQYRPGPVYGSLILGGYDTSRFEPNNVSFTFDEAGLWNFTVNIGSVILTTDQNVTVLSTSNGDTNSILTVIDSTTPYIWLPLSVCEQFEQAFGITWDENVQGYLVNDTLHQALLTQNTSVILTLGHSSTPGQGVNISLPYGAFDLVAQAPLVPNSSRYFPLMRADNEGQYTLGRAFLQEAYLLADYERGNFSVSQCTWDAGAKPHIVAIKSPRDSTPSSHQISTGAIVGIAIGGAIILVMLVLLGIWLYRRRHPKPLEPKQINDVAAELDSEEKDHSIATPDDKEKGHGGYVELDSFVHKGHEIDGRPFARQEVEAKEQPIELDATERRSRTLSSPISQMSERSDGPRLHQRQLSETVSLTSETSDAAKGHERGLSEPISSMRQTSDAPRLHKRELSDPVSLTSEISDSIKGHERKLSEPISPTSVRSDTAMGHQSEMPDPVSLMRERSAAAGLHWRESSDPISPMRARSDATRLHKRELSDPVSLLSDRAEERGGTL